MNRGLNLLRWCLILGFAALGAWIVFAGIHDSLENDFSSWAKVVALALTAVVSTIPFALCILAYQRRWRELLMVLIIGLTFLVWDFVFSLPRWLELLPWFKGKISERADWTLSVQGLASLVWFYASFRFAAWFYQRLLRVLDRCIPPQVPVKEWIKHAC